jgi:hypothetical protein
MANGTPDSYLTKQNGTFYNRRRVPANIQPFVGVKWWKKTLKTAREQVAKERARALATEHDEIIKAIRNAPLAEQHRLVTQSIDFIDDQAQTTPDDSVTRDLMKRALQAKAKLRRAMFAAAEQRLDTLPEDERNAIKQLGGVEAFFSQAEHAADQTEMEQIRLTFLQGTGEVDARRGEVVKAGLQAKAKHAAKDQQTLMQLGLLSREVVSEDENNPRINTALEKWLAERKQGLSASRRHRTAVRRFVAMHGNIPIGSITKAMVRDYVKRIEMLPDHRRLPSNQRGGLADPGTGVPLIAAPTVERHLVSIKALLKFCVEQDWLAVNVATGLKPPKDTRPKASKRRTFEREERNKLLRYAIDVDDAKGDGDLPWLIRMAAYTACRLEELAQLARSNVRQVDGVWVVEVDADDDTGDDVHNACPSQERLKRSWSNDVPWSSTTG